MHSLIGVALMIGLTGMDVAPKEVDMGSQVTEDVYRGELVAFPGPWSFELGKSAIILVSDQELEALADPDQVLNLSLTFERQESSLRQVCERAQAAEQRTLIVAFDHFFSQYRPGQAGPRRWTPDMDEYIRRIAALSRFAEQYGLGLELSLLSPLEIGPAYVAQTGESGIWMHYREGLRDPRTGAFSVALWQQQQWCNNKGPVRLEDAGVRVFAFRESRLPGTPYRVVDPQDVVEITAVAQVEVGEGLVRTAGDYRARRVRVHGRGRTEVGDLDRVMVVQQYRTPEMDYFSDKAQPFLKDLIDRYADAGVRLNALYSDEMHIQQDWAYFSHHDQGEFALRYVSPGLAQRFAELYGEEYRDFAKYLVYFTYGQEDFVNDVHAKAGVMHVFGASPEDIRRTALFRARYYHLLQDGVVDLFVQAKRHAEGRMGHRLEARAHATWAESPTCDYWEVGEGNSNRSKYEYTSHFVWSNTVHQSASACSDYFKWGDFLTGNGNDHAEGGWLDRNYLGLALACSTGILNEAPYSYAAHWGMPDEISRRRWSLACTYGTAGGLYGAVQDMQHRDVEVLMLYPLDLVAVEERFGSWMGQYGYANLITPAKLLERAQVVNGAIELIPLPTPYSSLVRRRFTTLVATFEPFPSARLLALMRQLAEGGGRVVWSGPPPVLTAEGQEALPFWKELFGVEYTPGRNEGLMAPGQQVTFAGTLAGVAPQIILTDFLVDRIYPVTPREGTEAVAAVKGQVVGTHRRFAGGGSATFLGYRPRDDQSGSLGYETRNWFEVLHALGAYPPTGTFPGLNDNTEFLSRTTDLLACRFPNGAVAITRHLRELEEDWNGGFARNREEDQAYLKRCPPPSEELHLRDFKVNGHTVTYDGIGAVAFRVNEQGELIAFAGAGCQQITVDGKTTVFADQPIPQIAWSPIPEVRQVPGGAVWQVQVHGTGTLRLPAASLPENLELVAEGPTPGSRGELIPHQRQGDTLVFRAEGAAIGRWLYGVPVDSKVP